MLLLEARDRVGGRTYTVEEDGMSIILIVSSQADVDLIGFLYEMGGTWVTHHFAYLIKEMMRYGMDRDLITTHHPGHENEYYSINVSGATPRNTTHEEAGSITARAWDIFVNVDGNNCKSICPLPHAQLDNIMVDRKLVEEVDRLSCSQRLDQIKHLLNPEEHGILSAVLVHITGGTLENSSLWDAIRSHALLVYSSLNFGDIWTTYKLREGQSTLARRMFDEAADFGLEYAFSTFATAISDESQHCQGKAIVSTADEKFTASRVVCTVPLNVLKNVKFSPPLSAKRQEAIGIGHVNFMSKIHAVVEGPGLTSWSGMRTPGHLLFGYGDGVTPNNDAHIVAFGADERDTFTPEKEPQKVLTALEALHPMHVKKTVSYSLGRCSAYFTDMI